MIVTSVDKKLEFSNAIKPGAVTITVKETGQQFHISKGHWDFIYLMLNAEMKTAVAIGRADGRNGLEATKRKEG